MKGKVLKLLAALACLTLAVGVTACGGNDGDGGDGGNSESNSSVVEDSSANNEILIGTEGLVYEINEAGDAYAVTDYTGTATKVQIPSVYEGLPVTSIGYLAFSHCYSLTEIVIPDSVTSIGEAAFYDCISLTSVVIGDSVTSIGSYAFCGCYSLTEIEVSEKNTVYKSIDGNLYSKDGTTLIQYAIGKTATSFTIPDSVTSIGVLAFDNCDSLTSVVIGNSVTSIGSNAFSNCDSLTEIVIPDSVTSIGSNAFYSCNSLTIYCEATSEPSGWDWVWNNSDCPVVWNSNNNEVADDGYIYTVIDGVRYALKDGATTVVEQQRNIEVANIPESITYKDIVYNVTSIGEDAFYDCSSLTSVVIGDSVTSIGKYAFGYCNSLTIYCEATSEPSGWDWAWNNSDCPVVWNSNNNEVADDGYIYTVIDGVRYALKDGVATVVRQPRNIEVANIPERITYKDIVYNVTSIGNYAFKYCDSLTEIVIPDSVTSIGDSAFSWCSSLTSVVIGDSVTSIGDDAFCKCYSLTEIVIPDSVTSIGNYAFHDCSSLTEIEVSEKNTVYKSIDGNVYSKRGEIFILYAPGKKATSFTIPDSVTSIGVLAFSNCSSLTSIVIPDSVTSIGEDAFCDCDSLTSIVIPDSVTSIGSYAFCGCSSLTEITFNGTVEQWNNVTKVFHWDYAVPATKVICTDGEVAL